VRLCLACRLELTATHREGVVHTMPVYYWYTSDLIGECVSRQAALPLCSGLSFHNIEVNGLRFDHAPVI